MTSTPYQIKDFAKSEMLFRAGDPVPEAAAEAFLVLEGRLEVFLDGADGEPLPLGNIEAGQIVGEMALLDGQPRSAHVQAGPKGARCAVITRTASSTRSFFSPLMIRVPTSIPSGRSWALRMVTAGRLSSEASSVMVPLSEITQSAAICNLT